MIAKPKRFLVLLSLVMLGIVPIALIACDHQSTGEHEDHDGHGDEGHNDHNGHEDAEDEHQASEVTLSANQIKLIELKTDFATIGEINLELLLTAEVTFNQDRLVHIAPRVPGMVHMVHKMLGDRVRAGEIMAVLESTELGEAKAKYLEMRQQMDLAQTDLTRTRTVRDNTVQMLDALEQSSPLESLDEMRNLQLGENRSSLVSAYSELIFAKARYSREKALYEDKISSEGEFLEAENEYKKAEARYTATRDKIAFGIERALLEKTRAHRVARLSLRAAQRHLHVLGLSESDLESLSEGDEAYASLTRYRIQAPFDATVIEKHLTQGEQVNEETDLYLLANLETVWVVASVYEKDIARVKTGQVARVMVKTYPNRKFTGKVAWIADTLDEETRTLKIRVEVDNKERRLKAGMFARIALGVQTKPNVLTIPPSALQTQGGQTIVFVDEGGGHFERREVRVGIQSATAIELLEGLQDGEKVVTNGSFILKSELEKAGFEAGHAH